MTNIYERARSKLAEALVDGKTLRIGGDYYRLKKQGTGHIDMKGDSSMRIAVTYENGEIFQHFGHTEQFKLYDVEDGKVVRAVVVDTNGSGHGALATFLRAFEVDTLICGGIGGGAINALTMAGIDLYPGISGSADMAVMQLIAGVLPKRTDVRCSHHDHHGEGHDCGSHGHTCGNHGCH